MVRVIGRGKTWLRIRASWQIVQRASWQEDVRYAPRRQVLMDGSANLFVGGSMGYHKGSGLWVMSGYSPDGSDVKQALEAMSLSWTQYESRQTRFAA